MQHGLKDAQSLNAFENCKKTDRRCPEHRLCGPASCRMIHAQHDDVPACLERSHQTSIEQPPKHTRLGYALTGTMTPVEPQSTEALRHVLNDIGRAEHVLLNHAENAFRSLGQANLKQQAQELITLLRQHAQDLQGTSGALESRPYSASTFASHPGSALSISKTALLPAFDGGLLSDLCTILISLYCRKAHLQADHASSEDIATEAEGPSPSTSLQSQAYSRTAHDKVDNSGVSSKSAASSLQPSSDADRVQQTECPAPQGLPKPQSDAPQQQDDVLHVHEAADLRYAWLQSLCNMHVSCFA